MKKMALVIFVLAGVAFLGCDDKKKAEEPKKDEPKAEKPAKAEEGKTKAEDTAKASASAEASTSAEASASAKATADKPADKEEPKAEVPKAPGPEVEQCNKILEKAWTAVQPALKMFGIEDPATVEESYKKSAQTYFVERCHKLTQELRDCLEAAENPISGIDTCKVNDGKKGDEKLYAPELRSHIKLFERKPLAEGADKKILAGLKGKWVNNWKEAKLHSTWTITKTGDVAEKKKGHSGKVEGKNFKIAFLNEGRMKIHWNESSSQEFTFLKAGKKVFFASGNLVYDFYPMKNKKSFVVKDSGDYIFFEKGKCQVVNEKGSITKGKCKFGKEKGNKAFKASWQFPGQVLPNGKPKVFERTYYVIGKNLVYDSLFVSGKFVKK